MFPSNTWQEISNEGIYSCDASICLTLSRSDRLDIGDSFLALHFLQSLLELESKRRLLINKVFLQPWLQVEETLLHETLPFVSALLGLDCMLFLFRSLAIDLISHHLLQVNAGYRLAAASALRHVFFEVCE